MPLPPERDDEENASPRGRLVVVSGPSGSGKTTICDRLVVDPRFVLSVSATTRPMRPGESEGVDYLFLTREAFQAQIAAGGLLEWAEVYGNLYGTPRAPVERAIASGRFSVLNIDVQGARILRDAGEDAYFVFLDPPSLTELEQRLRARATDSEAVIAHRLAAAASEMAQADRYDCRVVNDDAARATAEVRRRVLAASGWAADAADPADTAGPADASAAMATSRSDEEATCPSGS